MYSKYAQVFNYHCRGWTPDPVKNIKYLKRKQEVCNNILERHGYLYLDRALFIIGMPKVPGAEEVGWWLYDRPWKSNYVDFGIYDRTKKMSREFVNRNSPDIILDFNIDGNLADFTVDAALISGGPDRVQDFFESPFSFTAYLKENGFI